MRIEDLRTLSQLGQALWSQPPQSERVAIETMVAVAMQDHASEIALEKAGAALLRRAQRDGASAIERSEHVPFYRLSPEERFTLMALHHGRWSYARLGRILGIEAAEVEKLAWATRLRLASMPGMPPLPHPNGTNGPSCPDYQVESPWTQRFLDEELPKREQLFMQNHLMACDRCRHALGRCRTMYYAVDKALPAMDGPVYEDGRLERFEDAFAQAEDVKHPSMSFVRSMEIFLARRDIQAVLAVLATLLVARFI